MRGWRGRGSGPCLPGAVRPNSPQCSPRQPARRRHVRTDERYESVAQTLGRRGRSQAVAHADGAEDVGKHRHWQISEAGWSRLYGRRIVVIRHRFGVFSAVVRCAVFRLSKS